MIRRVQSWLPVRVLVAFGSSRASNYALALSFTALLSMFPLILGILSIIGFSVRDPATEARFQNLIIQVFPGSAQPELQNALHGVRESAGWLGLVSLGGLIWSASSLFATMEFALSQIFGTPQRDFVRQKLMGVVMMVVLVVAIGLTVAANTVVAVLPYAWVTGFAVGSIVMVVLLIAIYRLVPNRTFRLRDVVPGALLAGVLIEVVSLGFPLYERLAGGFNTYGAQFALFFLLAAWLYLLSELLLFGAVYNRFRLGEPGARGLFASPMRESKELRRPVEVIEEEQRDASAPGRAAKT
jgi:membrane protein